VFTIADPDLKLDQLEEVQRDVASLLEHGLNPAQPANETRTDPPTVVAAENSPSLGGDSRGEGEPLQTPTTDQPVAN
jgi:hypothetical protein